MTVFAGSALENEMASGFAGETGEMRALRTCSVKPSRLATVMLVAPMAATEMLTLFPPR